MSILCIRLLHLCLVLFVIIVPFLPRVEWTILVLHVSTVMTLLVHWLLNNDGCFLTMVESRIRGINESESFMHSIVSPVYKISDVELRELVSNITPLLGLVSLTRLFRDMDLIKSDLRFVYSRLRG
jgi:hypothetical protein